MKPASGMNTLKKAVKEYSRFYIIYGIKVRKAYCKAETVSKNVTASVKKV